jgi:hypothetical protein
MQVQENGGLWTGVRGAEEMKNEKIELKKI